MTEAVSELSKDDIREWEMHPVTRVFFQEVLEEVRGLDNEIHKCLSSPATLGQAAIHNAGWQFGQDILEWPDNKTEELKEGE